MNNLDLAYRPNAQAFDEIRIRTIPRYKQSHLSGDEWRISAVAMFYRNGELLHESDSCGTVQDVVHRLTALMDKACEENSYYAGEKDWCDQEGCSAKATIWYKRKHQHCQSCGDKRGTALERDHRKFCEKHKIRGDCGLDDADRNYVLVKENQEA